MPIAHTVNPYDTIEALIQQQERSHSQSQQSAVRLPSTPTSPTKEHPRIRGRMTPYAFFVQQRYTCVCVWHVCIACVHVYVVES